MANLRSAVIGTGVISEQHLRVLAAIPNTKIVGVCDLSPVAARVAAKRFRVGDWFTDYRELLKIARPDVVHVLTPPRTHKTIALECLSAGAHAIVEKPITLTYAELEELQDSASRAGRCLVEDHNYRFNEPILAMERIVADGHIGEIREVEIRLALDIRAIGGAYSDRNLPHPSHSLPAGVVHEFLTHLCYLLLRFMPSFENVSAKWSNLCDDQLFKYDDLDALVVGNGVHGRIRFSTHLWPEAFNVTVRASSGYLETDLFHPYLRRVQPRKGGSLLTPLLNQLAGAVQLTRASFANCGRKLLRKTPYEGLNTFLRLTYDALESNREPPVTFADMDATSRLTDALLDKANRL